MRLLPSKGMGGGEMQSTSPPGTADACGTHCSIVGWPEVSGMPLNLPACGGFAGGWGQKAGILCGSFCLRTEPVAPSAGPHLSSNAAGEMLWGSIPAPGPLRGLWTGIAPVSPVAGVLRSSTWCGHTRVDFKTSGT